MHLHPDSRPGLAPRALLQALKRIEREFGRRPGAARWSARVLDLDVILWSEGVWSDPALTVPHAAYRHRAFVLAPATTIAADWRDPLSGRSVRQHFASLTRPRPLPIRGSCRALSSVGRATDF